MSAPPRPPVDIAKAVIDPAIEAKSSDHGRVTAQDETSFYEAAGEQYKLIHNRQNLRVLGQFFGANTTAPTNIAGFVVICSFLFLTASFFLPENADMIDSRKWIAGLITSSLSFIFGAASKK